jgi:hypothetical protein
MNRSRVTVDHPLWKKLRKLDKLAGRRFPNESYDCGLASIGLILHPRPVRHGYWFTPKNALCFATNGGEGDFSFLVLEQRVTEQSPIVITITDAFGHPNFIGGESLFDFLCLGFHRGYFGLEQLPYKEKTLSVYSSSKWQPEDQIDWEVGFGVNDHQRRVMDYLISELGLRPWKDLKRKFKRLQRTYLHCLMFQASRRNCNPSTERHPVRLAENGWL